MVLLGPKVFKDLLELKAQLVLRDLLVNLLILELQVHKVLKDLRETQVRKEFLDRSAHRVLKGIKAIRDPKD